MFLKERRKFRFLSDGLGELVYDTAFKGPWTLAEWDLSAPEKQTNYVQIPGRDGAVDLYEGLTDGEPHYKQRTLTIRLTCSERDRKARTELVDDIVNTLDGFAFRIVLPDDPTRYIRGVCSVAVEYNDLNHCGVLITALCDPWRVSHEDVSIMLTASTNEQNVILRNSGRRLVIPVITGISNPDITLTCGTYTATVTDTAAHEHAQLSIGYKQARTLTYSGSGSFKVTWREAIL